MVPRRDALRRMSRDAFGQTYRLELMLVIAHSDDGLVTLTDLADRLGLRPSQIQRPLTNLIDLGLLTELPQGDARHRFLLRNPSAAWDWAREMETVALAADVTAGLPGT